MKRTASAAEIGFLALLCLAPAPLVIHAEDAGTASAATDADLKLLQGKWEGVEKGQENKGKCNLTIEGKTVSFVGSNPQEWYKATLEIRGDKNPKQLDGTITACPAESVIGKTSRGIYKVEGDTLTLVGRIPGSPDSPKSFDDAEQTRTFVLQRSAK
jgi:uncharacterized protein (TIGR03067 family)